jgi:hypothetical protein
MHGTTIKNKRIKIYQRIFVNVYIYHLLNIQTQHVRDTSHQSKSQTLLLGTKAVSGKFQYLLHKYDVKRS